MWVGLSFIAAIIMFSFIHRSSLFHLTLGLTLLVFGLLFLLSNYGFIPAVEWGKVWPVILIVLGLAFLMKGQGQMPQHHDRSWL